MGRRRFGLFSVALITLAGCGSAALAATLRRTPAGWTLDSSGGCAYRPVLPDGLDHVTWRIDEQSPPSPDSTEFEVLATEAACASGGPMGDRLLGPQVVETDTEVLVAFAAITKPGAQRCPGNPELPVTVTLSSPLGARTIRDGVPNIDVGALLAS